MREAIYQQAIIKAWQIVWKHRALWILGLIVSFWAQFGLGDFFSRVWFVLNRQMLGQKMIEWSYFLHGWDTMNWKNIIGVVWIFGICLAVFGGLLVLIIISQGAMVDYLASCFKNEKYDNLAKSWHKGARNFWKLLKINLIYKGLLCLSILFSAFLVSVMLKSEALIAILFLAIALSSVLFFYLVFSVVYIYSIGYAVVENKKTKDCLFLGWNLFSRHVLVSIEVGVLLMFFNLLLLVLIITGFVLAFLPSLFIWITAGIFDSMILAVLGLGVGLSIWVVMTFLVIGFLNAFATGSWIYLFMKMHKQGIGSRLVGLTVKIFKK